MLFYKWHFIDIACYTLEHRSMDIVERKAKLTERRCYKETMNKKESLKMKKKSEERVSNTGLLF